MTYATTWTGCWRRWPRDGASRWRRCCPAVSRGPLSSQASTGDRPRWRRRCSWRCRTIPASWPGSWRTPGRSVSTSRTYASTTILGVPSDWWSSPSPRPAWSTCRSRSRHGAGRRTGRLPVGPNGPEQSRTGVSVNVVVAMDGPSGSGKSSTSRGVATRLGLRYLDTGAMYRAMTWWMLENGIDVDDAEAVAAKADQPLIVSGTDPAAPTITIDGVDVAEPIRTPRITRAVSAVSAVPRIRQRLLQEQREIIGDGGIVVEGRDIGTVVAPDAPVKVFLTADADARAARRTAELGGGTVASTEQDLIRRDRADSGRAASLCQMAVDAHHVDATRQSLEEVVDLVVGLVEKAKAS